MKRINNNRSQKQRIEIDIDTLETFTCPECKNSIFTQAIEIKKVPMVISKTGNPETTQLNIVVCSKCGHKVTNEDVFGKETKII